MNINATLIGQSVAFFIFVLFCMKFVWPPVIAALQERQKKIADGLTPPTARLVIWSWLMRKRASNCAKPRLRQPKSSNRRRNALTRSSMKPATRPVPKANA